MNVLTRAYELALQGRNDALSAVDRNAIAKEVTAKEHDDGSTPA